MKQKLLLKTMLLLCILVGGVSSAWADDQTITLTYSSFGLETSYKEKTATVSGFGFTVNQGYKGSGNVIQMNSSKGSGILYNTTAIPGLKSIKVNVSSGNKTYTITTGTSEKPTANSQTGTTGGTYNASSGDTYFQLRVSGASYFSSIEITYTPTHTLTYYATNGSISGVVFNTSTAVESGASVLEGDKVTLTATPADGYTFSSWEVSGTGSSLSSTTDNPTTFTMGTANATVTANFVAAATSDYINVSPTTKDVTSAGGDAEFTITTDQTLDDDPTQFYTTADGDVTTTKPAWITEALYDEGTLLVTVAANTGAARTAYFRVEKGGVKSSVIAINQAAITVATPEFDVAAGTYNADQLVDITCATEGATIYYTTDGTTPAANNGTEYDGNGVEITATTTLKAIAIKNSVSSDVASATYTIYPVLHAGTAVDPYTIVDARNAVDAAGKTTVSDKYVTGIVSQVDSYNSTYNSITYWISDDGTTTNQFEVFGGLSFNGGTAFSSKDDIQVGDVVVVKGNITYYAKSSIYEFESNNELVSQKFVAPTFYPATGAVGSGTELTITDNHSDSSIYYTTDGSTPTTTSTLYNPSSKPTITAVTTFKAIAVKTGDTNDNYIQSDVASVSYTLLAPVVTPEITLAGGTYTSAQTTTITCETEGATIYYTTNGTNPTTSSTEYSGAISINESMTIKAIAVKDGMANSAVAEATYTINIPVINANAVNLTYDATEGTIAYTMTNPVVGGVLTAAITAGNEGSWLALGAVSASAVALTCSANEGKANRTATVTLTYTYDTDKPVTKNVTITQAYFVIDYAELPFEWDNTSTPTGITNSGVGTYSGSPYQKFDTQGDYLVLKINEAPGTLTYDIKGNSLSGTYKFTVLESANGTDYSTLKEYTSINSSKTSETLYPASSTRYIKWEYTTRASGNVALGNIVLNKVAPRINADNVNLAYDATNGSIAYTIINPVVGGVTTAELTTGDWLELGAVSTNVPFTTTANNTKLDRTATVTLTYTYDTSKTATKVVTITQAGNPSAKDAPTITVPDDVEIAYGSTYTVDDSGITGGAITVTSGNTSVATVSGLVITPVAAGTVEITVSTEEDATYAAGSETFLLTITAPTGKKSPALFYESFDASTGGPLSTWGGSEANGTVNTDNAGWTLTSGSGAGSSAKFGTGSANGNGSATTPSINVENGETYTLSFNAAPWSEETSKTITVTVTGGTINGNTSATTSSMTAQKWNEFDFDIVATSTSLTINFDCSANRFFLDEVMIEKSGVAPTATVTVPTSGFGTYCSEYPLDFSKSYTGLKAWYVSNVAKDGSDVKVTFSQVTKAIKGGQGILLAGTPGTHTVDMANSSEVLSDNKLVGVMTPTYIKTISGDNTIFGLKNGEFVKAAAGVIGANKAYLPIATSLFTAGARVIMAFDDDETTGISAMHNSQCIMHNEVFDLQGRKIAQPKKGLYIKNGKKVVLK